MPKKAAGNEAGFHEKFLPEQPPKRGSDRAFGLVFATVGVIAAALAYWNAHPSWFWWLAGAAAFLIIALTVPFILSPANWLWTRFGLGLHRVVQPVVLALLFFGTVLPTGLLMRVVGKDPLNRRLDAKATSYWIKRPPRGPDDSFKNQF
jgi:hypothetical protein